MPRGGKREGAGRKPKGGIARVAVLVRIPKPDADFIKAAANSFGTSVSAEVERRLRLSIKDDEVLAILGALCRAGCEASKTALQKVALEMISKKTSIPDSLKDFIFNEFHARSHG